MENSGNILFQDDTPHWYIAMGEKWIGPLSAADVYEKIQAQEITLAHYVWKQGQAEWQRICDCSAFQTMVPHQPGQQPSRTALQPGKNSGSLAGTSKKNTAAEPVIRRVATKIWFLHYRETQYGPFSEVEIETFLSSGKIHGRVFAWKNGMPNWERLDSISAFSAVIPSETGKKKSSHSVQASQKSEQRVSPRRPLLAKIIMADEQSVIVGMCRDISVGGLQVLTETIPGTVGGRLKMNISPSSNEAGSRIDPFVTEGLIARILEDGRGFSFRFTQLSEQAKKAIESYIDSPE